MSLLYSVINAYDRTLAFEPGHDESSISYFLQNKYDTKDLNERALMSSAQG